MTASAPLTWSGRFTALPASSHLPGDKIILPASALEQLLAAAPTAEDSASPTSFTSSKTFDPYNPYTFAAQRHARNQSQYQQQQKQLPYPLTFRLVNGGNGRVVYAGVQEFSAEESTVCLSPFLQAALGVSTIANDEHESNGNTSHGNGTTQLPEITVHVRQIPKGTFVKLRPLEAGYDPEDWKALLEAYVRKNFTTLSHGEILAVPAGKDEYKFLLDEFRPAGDAICVVDTDLEVDIEALSEEQARETLKTISDKTRTAAGTADGTSKGGELSFLRSETGQILEDDFVDYELKSWNRSSWLEIRLEPDDKTDELNLFASPLSTRQRARPRPDEHVFGDFEGRPAKRLRLSPTNVGLEEAESLWISIYAARQSRKSQSPLRFTIQASPLDETAMNIDAASFTTPSNPGESICPNCHRPIPSQSMLLHSGFCRRNNVPCPKGCGQVFQKNSDELAHHWHCPYDSANGNDATSFDRHNDTFHVEHQCPSPMCHFVAPTLPALAQHRTSTCPGKLILCRFCHLVVPQEGDADGAPNAEAIISGLTPHEVVDGGRTTDCHLCARIVRLRDMPAHLLGHEMERKSRPRPRVCRNMYCGRTLDGTSKSGDTRAGARAGQGAGNDIGLCSVCFGPLYVATHDPDGRALRRRVERRYLGQLVSGCGKAWCSNTFCKTGRLHTGGEPVVAKDARPLVQEFVDGLQHTSQNTPLHFCVDEASQHRRSLADMLAAESGNAQGHAPTKAYSMAWCCGALEAADGSLPAAREWLANFAPSITDEAASV